MTRLVHVATVASGLRVLSDQLAYMQAHGFDVHAVAADDGRLEALRVATGVTTHALDMTRAITPPRDIVSVWRMTKLLRRLRPDVVHAHTPKGGLVGMLAAALARVPARIYHIRGLRFETAKGLKRRLLKACERIACALAHEVLCVSHSVRDVAIAEGLVRPEKIRVLLSGSHGIDAEERFNPTRLSPGTREEVRAKYGIPRDAQVIGFIGRIVRDKGIIELASAWKEARSASPRAHLLLVGPFEAEDPIPDAVRAELENDPRVHFTGIEWDMPRMLCAMDVLCLPTYREGLPFVVLEAGAMGLPTVATRVPGCVDAVVDGVTGTLVPARDATALASALERYLANSELRTRHGANARERVLREFRPIDMWTATRDEYRRLLAERTRKWSPGFRRSLLRSDAPPTPATRNVYRRFGKRAIDLAIAVPALIALAPVLLVLACLVRWKLGSPVLFRQERPGRGGRPFRMVKFRTMTDARGADGELLSDEQRLTRFGKFLRATSLDEFPELWNVLAGDMSLVGPRPLLMRYLLRYSPEQARRHEVRPGVTGWAQVNGRNAIDWDEKLKLDVWYVDRVSLALDLKILALTVWRVLRRSDIQAAGHATAPEFFGTESQVAPRSRGEVNHDDTTIHDVSIPRDSSSASLLLNTEN